MRSATGLFIISAFLASPICAVKSSPKWLQEPDAGFRVVETGIKADAYYNSGPCPITVGFGGWITTNGPGVVRYTFTRSDGAAAAEETITFERAGTKQVRAGWTLGRGFKGWQAIKILSPNEVESNRAEFNTKCDVPATEFRVTEVGLKSDRYDYKGPCPITAGFGGYIRASGPGSVTYKFVRSDGGESAPKTIRFDKASYQEVRTSWRLGGAGFSAEERWVAIKILSPVEMESNQARFKVICSPR
jgi:hypothetical protein